MTDHDTLVESWRPDFQREHADDFRNATRQSFEDYWSWVKVFLVTGGAGQRGWLEQGDSVLRRIQDPATVDELRDRLRGLGRTIAAEWAKDSRTRRIHTTFLQGSPNLRDWGKQLERAADADRGDGASIARAVDAIDREVRSALGR
jgi:hypothetical protein